MPCVSIRFYEELNDFLAHQNRKRAYTIRCNDARSVKDVIEAEGVPHTEVDLILVNGESEGFEYQIHDGDRISVYPCFETLDICTVSRLGRPPLRSPSFIADVNLGKLCRNLRLLGLDCIYDHNAKDEKLAKMSQHLKRILLTRDRELLKRKIISHGLFIHNTDPIEQVKEVIRRIHLNRSIAPFTRCVKCNGKLFGIDKEQVAEQIPEETYQHIDQYYKCDDCQKIYWQGAHWKKLNQLLKHFGTNF